MHAADAKGFALDVSCDISLCLGYLSLGGYLLSMLCSTNDNGCKHPAAGDERAPFQDHVEQARRMS